MQGAVIDRLELLLAHPFVLIDGLNEEIFLSIEPRAPKIE